MSVVPPVQTPPDEQHAARLLLRRCPRKHLRARDAVETDVLCEAGLVIVERGLVLLRAVPPASRRPIVLAVEGRGAIMAPPRRHEQLVGLTDASLTIVGREEREALLALPGVATVVVDAVLDTARDRQESLANATGGSHVERLRAKLVQLARRHGKVCADGIEIGLPLTHELLAQMLGSARETVTCALRELRRSGFVVRKGRTYLLVAALPQIETGATSRNENRPRRGGRSVDVQVDADQDQRPQHGGKKRRSPALERV